MPLRPIRRGEAAPKHPFTSFPDELPRISPRKPDSHKGDFGTGLVIGGSVGMAGAAAMAGIAVLRCGAGLVRLAVPKSILSTVAALAPEYMTAPLAEDAEGRIDGSAVDRVMALAHDATAVAVGPGLGRSQALDELVVRLYRELPQPAVFDADALNALAPHPDLLALPGGPRVLTPHPGEFRRLIGGRDPGERVAYHVEARPLAARTKTVVVLKGYRTFVTDGPRSYINNTGNPGMATGGTGDVLTGVITGLLCQGLAAYDAARLGVYIHGHAGDSAAEELGQMAMLATDILHHLPNSLRYVVKTS
jgi:ADP-dependent NAD(P)H-hydrate dehydratase